MVGRRIKLVLRRSSTAGFALCTIAGQARRVAAAGRAQVDGSRQHDLNVVSSAHHDLLDGDPTLTPRDFGRDPQGGRESLRQMHERTEVSRTGILEIECTVTLAGFGGHSEQRRTGRDR